MNSQVVHAWGEQAGPLCGTHATSSTLYAAGDDGRATEDPERITCLRCLRILEADTGEA